MHALRLPNLNPKILVTLAAFSLMPFVMAGTCEDRVAAVQKLTVAICGFLPTAITVTNILSINIPGDAGDIASSICDAVAPKKAAARARGGAAAVYLNGVRIEGKFVR